MDIVLYMDGVTVSFDGFKALNNLSLLVWTGDLRAVIGPNGAGKTTMMDVITGKTRPDKGRIIFNGRQDLTKLDEAACSIAPLVERFAADLARGVPDAPWPPVYPKMPHEAPRVQPSRARSDTADGG